MLRHFLSHRVTAKLAALAVAVSLVAAVAAALWFAYEKTGEYNRYAGRTADGQPPAARVPFKEAACLESPAHPGLALEAFGADVQPLVEWVNRRYGRGMYVTFLCRASASQFYLGVENQLPQDVLRDKGITPENYAETQWIVRGVYAVDTSAAPVEEGVTVVATATVVRAQPRDASGHLHLLLEGVQGDEIYTRHTFQLLPVAARPAAAQTLVQAVTPAGGAAEEDCARRVPQWHRDRTLPVADGFSWRQEDANGDGAADLLITLKNTTCHGGEDHSTTRTWLAKEDGFAASAE